MMYKSKISQPPHLYFITALPSKTHTSATINRQKVPQPDHCNAQRKWKSTEKLQNTHMVAN